MIATFLAALMLVQQQDTTEVLGPATIYGESKRQELMHMSLSSVEVGRNYIEKQFSAKALSYGLPRLDIDGVMLYDCVRRKYACDVY